MQRRMLRLQTWLDIRVEVAQQRLAHAVGASALIEPRRERLPRGIHACVAGRLAAVLDAGGADVTPPRRSRRLLQENRAVRASGHSLDLLAQRRRRLIVERHRHSPLVLAPTRMRDAVRDLGIKHQVAPPHAVQHRRSPARLEQHHDFTQRRRLHPRITLHPHLHHPHQPSSLLHRQRPSPNLADLAALGHMLESISVPLARLHQVRPKAPQHRHLPVRRRPPPLPALPLRRHKRRHPVQSHVVHRPPTTPRRRLLHHSTELPQRASLLPACPHVRPPPLQRLTHRPWPDSRHPVMEPQHSRLCHSHSIPPPTPPRQQHPAGIAQIRDIPLPRSGAHANFAPVTPANTPPPAHLHTPALGAPLAMRRPRRFKPRSPHRPHRHLGPPAAVTPPLGAPTPC
jgi:hypothetical protein